MVLQNKNIFSLLFGLLLIIYLYLGTPVPANIMLNNIVLIFAVLISAGIVIFLSSKVNIFVGIIFALVAFEVIRKSLTPNLDNIDKNIQYYNNSTSNADVVLSDKLKKSNTLEQEMVSNMESIVGNNIGQSPRYQPILADTIGVSNLE